MKVKVSILVAVLIVANVRVFPRKIRTPRARKLRRVRKYKQRSIPDPTILLGQGTASTSPSSARKNCLKLGM